MKKRDARTLKIEAQQELRNQIVRMKKLGMSAKDISKTTESSIEHISRICNMYKTGGKKAITLQTRGRKEGAKRDLTPEQESNLIKRLIDTTHNS